MDFGIASVAAITVICYLIGQVVKASGVDNKWIPIACGVSGGLLGIADTELTLGGRKAIARWYEVYGYDDAMVQEAAVQAGPKRDLWYWNSILKTWNAKGLRTVHDVRGPVAGMGASRNLRVDRAEPSGNDFLKNAARRRPLRKKTDTPAE